MSSKQTLFSNLETAAFCDQMVLILKSGVSAIEGVTLMLEDTKDASEQKILNTILDSMMETGIFHEALRKTGVFPEYMLNMVAIGEESGRLDEVMGELALHYEREDSIRQSIRSTVMYPMIMTGMLVVVIVILLVKVMPIFKQVFSQLGTEMTGFSGALVGIGETLNNYSIVFIGLLALIVVLGLIAWKTPGGRKAALKLGYKFPSIRYIIDSTAACRFADGMSLALSSGLTPDRSMELSSSLITDEHFKAKFDDCLARMEEGSELSRALQESGIFSGVYSRIANIGQKTGSVEQSMGKIANLYQDEIDSRMSNLLAVLEPTMVIILSIVVGIILLSVMLPLIGIMSGI